MTAIAIIPDETYPTAAILRIATMIAAMLAVREEREAEADELRPKPQAVEDVFEVPLDQKTIRCGGATPGYIAGVTLKAVIEVMEEEFGVTAAGSGGDEEDESDDDL